jgi:hypothetical protein
LRKTTGIDLLYFHIACFNGVKLIFQKGKNGDIHHLHLQWLFSAVATSVTGYLL